MEIQGSVVVVTGASSGIRLATARSFAQAGAKVVLAARSSETINAVAEELRELGYEAICLSERIRATSARCAKEHEPRGDLVAEVETTSMVGDLVKSPKADFS